MTEKSSDSRDGEINLLELGRVLMAKKWLIIFLTLIFAAGAVVYALSLPDIYKSEVLLVRAGETDNNNLGRMAGQLSGLASLAGFDISGGKSSKSAEAMEILKSWSFIEEFIQEQDIAPEVYVVTGWLRDSGKLVYDESKFDSVTRKWAVDEKTNQAMVPSSWQLYETFKGYLSVTEGKNETFVTISVEYYSPELAQRWAAALVEKVNRKLQERDIEESKRNIDFLHEQIERTSVASMQSIFYQLLESQIKTLMLAKGSNEYVFRTISSPRVAEIRSKPNRAIICIMGVLFGGMIGIFLGLVSEIMRKDNKSIKRGNAA